MVGCEMIWVGVEKILGAMAGCAMFWVGVKCSGLVWLGVKNLGRCVFKGVQRINFCLRFLLGFCPFGWVWPGVAECGWLWLGVGWVWLGVAGCGRVWVGVGRCGRVHCLVQPKTNDFLVKIHPIHSHILILLELLNIAIHNCTSWPYNVYNLVK